MISEIFDILGTGVRTSPSHEVADSIEVSPHEPKKVTKIRLQGLVAVLLRKDPLR
jgi:hypothetical protein